MSARSAMKISQTPCRDHETLGRPTEAFHTCRRHAACIGCDAVTNTTEIIDAASVVQPDTHGHNAMGLHSLGYLNAPDRWVRVLPRAQDRAALARRRGPDATPGGFPFST